MKWQWTRWRLKSPALRLLTQPFIQSADQSKHESSASLAFVGNLAPTGEFPAQRASNAENVSFWWRHHENLHKGWKGFWIHTPIKSFSWWRHQIETFSALLASDAKLWCFLLSVPEQTKRLNKQSRRRWFEKPLCALWHHCSANLSLYAEFHSWNRSKKVYCLLRVYDQIGLVHRCLSICNLEPTSFTTKAVNSLLVDNTYSVRRQSNINAMHFV